MGRALKTVFLRLTKATPMELVAMLWSFTYFFCLLCSYYILRPMRDEMGILGGVENLQWLFTGTFLVMLLAVPAYGALVTRFPRRRLLPFVYHFFVICILLFFVLVKMGVAEAHIARAFFIWTSVFNLFVVSVFWSFMADIFRTEQGKRLFGFIAAGGSAGAVIGPLLTQQLVPTIGVFNLLLISAILLEFAVICVIQLNAWSRRVNHALHKKSRRIPPDIDRPIGGSIWAGLRLVIASPYLLGIGAYIVLFTTTSTILYFEQAHIMKSTLPLSADRTAMFATMDFSVNALTIVIQLFLTGRLLSKFGIGIALALLPGMVMIGFTVLGLLPILAVIVIFQVIRRVLNYAIARPAREVLYTVVGREARYKAKSVIDTLVYRGGDALSGWFFAGLIAIGMGLSAISFVAVPIAGLWMVCGFFLGRRQATMTESKEAAAPKLQGDADG